MSAASSGLSEGAEHLIFKPSHRCCLITSETPLTATGAALPSGNQAGVSPSCPTEPGTGSLAGFSFHRLPCGRAPASRPGGSATEEPHSSASGYSKNSHGA